MTKIQTRYLEALENGDFTVLPERYTSRGRYREYTLRDTIGLNSEEVLALYNKLRHEVMEAGEARATGCKKG